VRIHVLFVLVLIVGWLVFVFQQALHGLVRLRSSNHDFVFRILSVRGGHFGKAAILRLLEKACPNTRVIFTEDPSFTDEIHLVIEGAPNLYHLSECGPRQIPWAQYSAEPGSLYNDDDWCHHDHDPIFRIDTSLEYLERTKFNTSFLWSPYASIVDEDFLGQQRLAQRHRLDDWGRRPYFLAWIASNCHSKSRTSALAEMLEVARERKISGFHSLGECMPNTKISIPPRDSGWTPVVDIYKHYRFVISFENSIEPGYVTEKLVTALAGGAVPVYFGDGDAARMIFPDDDFIDVRDVWQDSVLKYDEGRPNASHWRRIFEYLMEIDDDTAREKIKSLKKIPRKHASTRSVPPGQVPFPSQELSKETIKDISEKISKIVHEKDVFDEFVSW
jgi:hypothetical protein